MICPVCKKEVNKTSIYCSYCGQFAPNADWFLNDFSIGTWGSSFDSRIIMPRTVREEYDLDNENAAVIEADSSSVGYFPEDNIREYVLDNSYPWKKASLDVIGDGSSEESLLPVTISETAARCGVSKILTVGNNSDGYYSCKLFIPPMVSDKRILRYTFEEDELYLVIHVLRISLTDFSTIGSEKSAVETIRKTFNVLGEYPIRVLGTKKYGDGFSEDEPYQLKISGREAKRGAYKTINTYDKNNKSYLTADLHLPGNLVNGQLLEMYADDTKLYISVHIDKRDELLLLKSDLVILLGILSPMLLILAGVFLGPRIIVVGVIIALGAGIRRHRKKKQKDQRD